jgi:ferrous iron transport protein B
VIRKEAALVLLTTVAGTADIRAVMSPVQMIVFALVIMIYVPCIATIAALIRETGWKNAALISLSEIGLAVLLGGIAFRVLSLFM